MNPEKFTHKTNETIAAAHELAVNSGHAQITPLHLAGALISDPPEYSLKPSPAPAPPPNPPKE